MSFKYCLILLVQEHEHFIQHHYFWNNLVYEWRQTIGGLGHASDESWIIVYACSGLSAGEVLEMQYPHLHFTLLGNLICLPLVLQWYFSVLVLLGLCTFSLASFLGLVLYIQGHNETQKRCSVSTIGTQYKHSSSFNREHKQPPFRTVCFGWILTCTQVASFLCDSYRSCTFISIQLVCETRDESGCRNLQYSKRIQLIFQLDTTWSSEIFALQDAC